MKIADMSLAEIVTTQPAAAGIFDKMQLDFCCKGKRKLKDVLSNDSRKFEEIIIKLENIFNTNEKSETDFNSFSLSNLTDYIVENHHQYTREAFPLIKQHLDKVVSKHGDNNPEMKVVSKLFSELSTELEDHMIKEELILFPKIRNLESDMSAENYSPGIEPIINVMETEHSDTGNILSEINRLTNRFMPPEDACITFRICLEELKMLEEDIHKHIHLENNILFPKAIILQNNLNRNSKTYNI